MSGQGSQVPLSRREQDDLTYSPQAVAAALVAKRVAQGMTRAELARQLRVDAETIRNWERGRMPLTAARVLSYVFAEEGRVELYRERALRSEKALKRITETMSQYRDGVRRDLAELNGGHKR